MASALSKRLVAGVAAALTLSNAGIAEDRSTADGRVGVLEKPCAELARVPAEVTAYMAAAAKATAAHQAAPTLTASDLSVYTEWQTRRSLQDFAGLCRYHDENAALAPPSDHRVVFFGDSITELWRATDPGFFTNDTLNRGISGQTTAQMVGRFQEDVIALHPRVVHLLVGTNDVAGNTGPTTVPWIEANIRTMVELAKAHHVRVVVASVLPAARFSWRPAIEPVPQIQALNDWLEAYAKTEHLIFVDYRPLLDDGRHGFKPELSGDGVHPNRAAYALMRPPAQRAIKAALR